jgi:metal-responsive CopG/Arc/MetJ family transcriptional regulator
MRTSITIPDDLATQAQELAEGRPLSEFTREAIRERVSRLKTERLAREMEAGYRAEAEEQSLAPEWAAIEVEGL